MLERDDLKPNQMYYLWERKEENGSYFYTPDGVGGYWYDTDEEMLAEHGFDGAPNEIIHAQIPSWF